MDELNVMPIDTEVVEEAGKSNKSIVVAMVAGAAALGAAGHWAYGKIKNFISKKKAEKADQEEDIDIEDLDEEESDK